MSHTRTVLVVDDEMLIRWSLSEALADAGFVVREAPDGRSAEKLFAAGVDAVILDLRLPDVNGLVLLERFKARSPEVPVVMMSAHAGAADEAEAMRLGAVGMMRKPFELMTMLRQIDRMVAAGH